jgi:Protein of unknown function (DUF1565)
MGTSMCSILRWKSPEIAFSLLLKMKRFFALPIAVLCVTISFVASLHAQVTSCPFNVAQQGAPTSTVDGLLLLRYARNVRGTALYDGIRPAANLTGAQAFIEANLARLDVDGDSFFTATDAIIIERYLKGYAPDAWPLDLSFAVYAPRKTGRSIKDFFDAGCPSPVVAPGAIYVATTGNDATGNGSTAKPYRTIGKGISAMASGGTVIVKAGEYSGKANFVNSRLVAIPNGTAAAPTTIRAEVPLSVRIKNLPGNVEPLNYYDDYVMLDVGTNYVVVDGFILDHSDSQDPSLIAEVNGNFNKLTRTIVKRSGETDQYGGWFYVGGNDNLLEDTAGVGSARYGYSMGGPYASSQRNVIRRAVGRVDYSVSTQPKATFNIYGNQDGSHNVRDNLLQNLVAIDGRKGSNTGESTYGGFYFPKEPQNTTIQGSIALNVEAEYSGYFIRELRALETSMVDSVAWGGYGTNFIAGIRANASDTGALTLDRVTVGGYANGYYNLDSAPVRALRNSAFIGNAARTSGNDYGWTTITNNAFFPAAQVTGANAVTATAGTLKYIVRPEPGSVLIGAGSGGTNIGADVTKQYGVSGTRYGETGYDQKTNIALWPWPYEDVIKAVFAETNPAPPTATPSSNTPARGFAAAGNDAFGKPLTLTRYIWQYLGNKIPAEIYGE